MKLLTLLFFLVLSVQAEDAKDQKVYTEADYQKKLKEDLEKNLKRLGKANIVPLMKELLDKEAKLNIRENELSQNEEKLKNNEKEFQSKIVEFKDSQKKFLSCIDDIDAQHDKRISHMVEAISGMKPQKAAGILSVQDSKISIQILGQLDPVKVSKIFNLMDKEISARLQKQYMTMKK